MAVPDAGTISNEGMANVGECQRVTNGGIWQLVKLLATRSSPAGTVFVCPVGGFKLKPIKISGPKQPE